MSDHVIELFEEFLRERDAGSSPDPAEFAHRAGDDREALAGMIAAYLATRPPDPVSAEDVIAFAARPELATARPWSELLPARRGELGLKRSRLVERLAAALGVTGSEPQVGGYVHELETGQRSPRQVRSSVVAALAVILEVPRSRLEASRGLDPASPQAGGLAFARMAAAPANEMGMLPPEPDADPRVDDLFTGGPDG
jgi:hypothetical protein